MSFIADKQTLKDLNLLGKYSPDSIFSLFNHVKTHGGEKLLDHMFRSPLPDEAAINQRTALFHHFQQLAILFPFERAQLETVEGYITEAGDGNMLVAGVQVLRKQMLKTAFKDERYALMSLGIDLTLGLLRECRQLVDRLGEGGPYVIKLRTMRDIVFHERLSWVPDTGAPGSRTFLQTVRCNHVIRHVLREEMMNLLQLLYELDVLIAVSNVARARGFSYPLALPASAQVLHLEDVRHPGLKKGIPNDLHLSRDSNMLFLTGANMAGKSTLMKTVGVALYLGHMGFPVAAAAMSFSVKDGMFTSINVPDDLSMGYSHFYAEVLRVKHVAEAVGEGKNLLIIFDELFKGTNVKDAYDATLAVSAAFAAHTNCSYIISTHIIEVGDALKQSCRSLRFGYMPTVMKGILPTYTYRMMEGVTTDRQGMMIIENEGIVDIIRSVTPGEKPNIRQRH